MAMIPDCLGHLVQLAVCGSDGRITFVWGRVTRFSLRPQAIVLPPLDDGDELYRLPLPPPPHTDIELRLEGQDAGQFAESDRNMVAMAMAVLSGDREAALQLADKVLDTYHKER